MRRAAYQQIGRMRSWMIAWWVGNGGVDWYRGAGWDVLEVRIAYFLLTLPFVVSFLSICSECLHPIYAYTKCVSFHESNLNSIWSGRSSLLMI